ncbi:MAG: IreB family regulatory phosphoprotein [Clostridia bacterium]|nr:IreB family regulatory phosphoprotein [Clostridia bacterium]
MNSRLGDTRQYPVPTSETNSPEEILRKVYDALKAKGYDPITQIVGYILSGDPTYITSYNQARSLIRRLERDEILEELVRSYIRQLEA